MICIILTGCKQIYENFDNGFNEVENLIEESKWDEALIKLDKMQKQYEKSHQWRDFYIEPDDLTTLAELLGTLKGSIKQEESKEALIQIETIRAFIKEIYYQ